MKIEEEKYFVQIGMTKYGGSFASALGKALICADMQNTQKIMSMWPDLWKKYLEMGQTNKEE